MEKDEQPTTAAEESPRDDLAMYQSAVDAPQPELADNEDPFPWLMPDDQPDFWKDFKFL